jgi:hypothetical protein
MEKFRKLVDQFFCTPNIALYVFFAVMLSLSIGIVVKHAHVAKPAHAAQGPRNLVLNIFQLKYFFQKTFHMKHFLTLIHL